MLLPKPALISLTKCYPFLLVLILSFGQSACAEELINTKQSTVALQIEKTVAQIKQEYDIDLIFDDVEGKFWSPNISYAAAQPDDLGRINRFLRIIEKEINKYPGCFFKNRKMRAIYLVKKLFIHGSPAQGIYLEKPNVILFDFKRKQGGDMGTRHAIHHEFYHLFDAGLNGPRDDIWTKFNSPGFSYQQEGQAHEGMGENRLSNKHPEGFATDYAMTSAMEDKAELFACLMIGVQRKLIDHWAKDDSVLRNKLELLKGSLAQYCQEMNNRFWQSLVD